MCPWSASQPGKSAAGQRRHGLDPDPAAAPVEHARHIYAREDAILAPGVVGRKQVAQLDSLNAAA
jgi:hypothetical protein